MIRAALDSVVVIALIDERDKWHNLAVAIKDALKSVEAEIVLLDPVINETVSVLMRRLYEQGRTSQIDELLQAVEQVAPPKQITWISSEIVRLYPQIMALVQAHDGLLNFHDALIALGCQELNIEFLASFDQDFDRIAWLTRISSPQQVAQVASEQDPDGSSNVSETGE